MKSKFFFSLILAFISLQMAQASNHQPKISADPFSNMPAVISFVHNTAVADALAMHKDTTITIYGSGGMNNDKGTICPNTATSTCGKIVISGLVAPGSNGDLLHDGVVYSVTVKSISDVSQDQGGNPSVEGKNFTYYLNR